MKLFLERMFETIREDSQCTNKDFNQVTLGHSIH